MKKTIWIILLMLLLSAPSQVLAGEYTDQMVHDLSRGFQNIVTGWTEIPIQIAKYHNSDEAPVVREIRGLFHGISNAIARTGSGFWDLGAAFMPGHQEGEPVEPETLFE